MIRNHCETSTSSLITTRNDDVPIDEYRRRAFVVFSGQTDLKWLRILKPGFRHCFVLLSDKEHWLCLDPLSNRLELFLHPVDPHFDFVHFYADRGMAAVRATILPALPKPAPLGVFTCVETVKRVLGIRHRRIVTPRQLHKFLAAQSQP